MGIQYPPLDKMKLTLVFLVCFVGLACAQYVFPQYHRAPYYYYPEQFHKYAFVPHLQKQGPVQARTPNEEDFSDPDGRFFNFLTSYTSNIITTVTSTSFFTETSTATVGSSVQCIPLAQFAAGSQTVACRRRRSLADLIKEDVKIAPSAVQTMEMTAEPQLLKREVQPELISTREREDGEVFSSQRDPRLFLSLTFVSTVSSTVTTYSFVTTGITTTLNVAAAGAVLCIPNGVVLC